MNRRSHIRRAAIGLASIVTLSALVLGTPVKTRIAYNVMTQGDAMFRTVGFRFSHLFRPGEYRGNTLEDDASSNLDMPAIYLGMQENPFPISRYRPTSLTGKDELTFRSPGEFAIPHISPREIRGWPLALLERLKDLEEGEIISDAEIKGHWRERIRRGPAHRTSVYTTKPISVRRLDLLNYTVSIGRDEKGTYASIYDSWDFLPTGGTYASGPTLGEAVIERIQGKPGREHIPKALARIFLPRIGEPIHFYERFYFEDEGTTQEVIEQAYQQRLEIRQLLDEFEARQTKSEH